MTSHSTHVSSHSSLDSLIIFYKVEGETISNRVGSIFDLKVKEHRQYKRYLERWLDATKSDIFFGRKVLLVEGIAERLLMPKFFSMLYKEKIVINGEEVERGKTLEGEGISIISVDGVAFRPFLQLFGQNGLNIKCAVLTDSDPAAIPVKDNEGNDIILGNNKILKEEAYPSKMGEIESCQRTLNLLNDFHSTPNVYISNNIKTFEYDLLLEKIPLSFQNLFKRINWERKKIEKEFFYLKGRISLEIATI